MAAATQTIAIGWSSYVDNVLEAVGLTLPAWLLAGPADGGWLNLPAAAIVLALALLLSLGARESARVNAAMVLVKLLAIARGLRASFWLPFGARAAEKPKGRLVRSQGWVADGTPRRSERTVRRDPRRAWGTTVTVEIWMKKWSGRSSALEPTARPHWRAEPPGTPGG